VPRTAIIPVVGFGTVRPKNQVQIVPQVSGELVYSHIDLAEGKIIAKGALLFEMDPSVYQARVQQAEAEERALEAALARNDQEMANLDARVIIAQKMLAIDERDYLTSRHLLAQEGVGTQQGLDATHQKYLQRQSVLVQLQNQRATAPHLKQETQARLDAARARVLQAQHDLKNTKIFCPFSARVESVKAYQSQMVTAHLSIATLTDMEAFELPISVDPRELRWLARQVQPKALGRESGHQQPEVKIAWSAAGQEAQWRGHVARFERMDELTRTARMIVEIRGADMAGGRSTRSHYAAPVISIGMHCRAELPAEPLLDAVLIPWHAVHEDRWVYVFEPVAERANQGLGRLGRREVSILRLTGDEVLVDYRGREGPHRSQLKPGEQLVVSRLDDPVIGMQVALQETLDSAPTELDRPSPAAPTDFATMGSDVARLAMSDSAGQIVSEE
jgi:multidrug efflux pump subunit AcrA (membrane-fusion protein)